MALGATVLRFRIELSDVDRSVYESLDLRVAQHPSETLRHVLLRVLAYACSHEPGLAFSKGGLADAEEPALSVRDATGRMLAWIDVGSPSAERLHKASKACPRVLVFTTELAQLRREAKTRAIHRADAIEVWRVDPALVAALEPLVGKQTSLDVTRSDGRLYVTAGGGVHEGAIDREGLGE